MRRFMDEKNTFQVSKEKKKFSMKKAQLDYFTSKSFMSILRLKLQKAFFFPDIYMLVNRMYAQNIPYIYSNTSAIKILLTLSSIE